MVAPCADFDTRSLLEYPTRIAGQTNLEVAFDDGRAAHRRGVPLTAVPRYRLSYPNQRIAREIAWRRGWGYEARRTMRARSRTMGA